MGNVLFGLPFTKEDLSLIMDSFTAMTATSNITSSFQGNRMKVFEGQPSLQRLWSATRLLDCTNSIDHVYAILGMADQSLFEHHLALTLEASVSATEVFTAFTRVMLAESGSLTMLGFTTGKYFDPSEDTPALPSWALRCDRHSWSALGKDTDMKPIALEIFDLIRHIGPRQKTFYAASGLWPPDLQIANDSIFNPFLKLKGLLVDTVVDVQVVEDFDELSWLVHHLHDWTAITSSMNSRYRNGETLAKVLFWTVLAGQVTATHLFNADEAADRYQLRLMKQDWINCICISLQQAQSRGEDISVKLAELDRLALVDEEGYIASSSDVTHFSWLSNGFEDEPADVHGIEDDDDVTNDAMVFEVQYSVRRMCRKRLLYATAEGRLGLGPFGLCTGDQVWIVPGSTVPFILRSIGDGRYVMVGETYIRDIMFGEAVPECDDVELTDIELV